MIHSFKRTILIFIGLAGTIALYGQRDSVEMDSIINRIQTLLESYMEIHIYTDTSDYEHGYFDSKNINLQIAASRGDCFNIIRLIAQGASVNNFVGENATPLHFAVSSGELNAVEILLLLGADTEKADVFGNTALITATKNNDLEMTELLIRHGASLSGSDRNKSTSLHHAAALGNFYLADMLIYYNAPLDVSDNEGNTPLLIAVWKNDYDITEALLTSGADPNMADRKGFTPFLMAAQNGDTLMMRILSRYGANIYASNTDGYNALCIAVSSGNKEIIAFLLENFFSWKTRSENKVSPVDVAVNYGNRDLIPLLKQYGYSASMKIALEDFALNAGGMVTNHYSMLTAGIAIREPKYMAGVTAGSFFNPARTRLQIMGDDDIIYQYRVKTSVIYVGLFKEFTLDKSLSDGRLSAVASLSAGYRFYSYYSGTRIKPEDNFCVIPYAGVEWSKKIYSIKTGICYLNTPFHKVSPVWISAGISLNFYKDYSRIAGKRIRLYDYE